MYDTRVFLGHVHGLCTSGQDIDVRAAYIEYWFASRSICIRLFTLQAQCPLQSKGHVPVQKPVVKDNSHVMMASIRRPEMQL